MAFGGLWESWQSPGGETIRSVCIVTTGANELMAPIHDRMPVIISPDNWQNWLAGPVGEFESLVVPYPANEMRAWPVSRRVNRTGEDDAEMIEPADSAN